jgi:hypothetical protein
VDSGFTIFPPIYGESNQMTPDQLRAHIRNVLNEAVNNYIESQPETKTKQLKDNSKSQNLGDPMDVKLNQQANEFGSDEKNAPTVSVKAGATKGGSNATAGQKKASFTAKTTLAK